MIRRKTTTESRVLSQVEAAGWKNMGDLERGMKMLEERERREKKKTKMKRRQREKQRQEKVKERKAGVEKKMREKERA